MLPGVILKILFPHKAMFLIGKGAISGALAVVYVFTAELFPTSVRGAAVGTCSTFGRLGAVITPWISGQVSFVLLWKINRHNIHF